MQLDAPDTRRALERMVARLTSHSLWREDLVQEALIHLWQEERRCPGQSPCWYLRSCRFHLLNQMRLGRSIDSPKRRNGFVLPRDGGTHADDVLDSLADSTEGASVLEAVMARDFVSALFPYLAPMEREVLACLAEGLGTRETARRLKLSHTCVTKKRRAIADLVHELEPETRTKTIARRSNGRNGSKAVEIQHRRKPSSDGFQFHARITSLTKSEERCQERSTINTIRP